MEDKYYITKKKAWKACAIFNWDIEMPMRGIKVNRSMLVYRAGKKIRFQIRCERYIGGIRDVDSSEFIDLKDGQLKLLKALLNGEDLTNVETGGAP